MIVAITGAGSGLQGVGRAPDGRAVFVPGALPGETVEARPVKEKERFIEAALMKVLDPSPSRVAPPCPYYAQCGGCAALHMDYATSLALKRDRVVDALCRLGGVDCPQVSDVYAMPDPFRTRNKAEYAIQAGRIGLRREGSHLLVEVGDCLVQAAPSVAALLATRSWLTQVPAFNGALVTRITTAGDVMCVLAYDKKPTALDQLADALLSQVPGMQSFYACQLNPRPVHALDGRCTRLRGEAVLIDTLMGLKFRLQPQSFFQVNPQGAQALYQAALTLARLTGGQTVLDAYCGAGTITLTMAAHARTALGVEIVPQAVEDARANARLNHMEHKATFQLADAALALPALLRQGPRPDVVVVDPPRKGVDEKLIAALNHAAVPRLVYVSCDPGTLARDVKRLSEVYRLQQAQVVDMFPWSHHVETAALLTRADMQQM